VEVATYMQERKLYINLSRNMYRQHPEYNEMIKRMFTGQEFTFASVSGFDTKTIAQASEGSESGKSMRAKRNKTYD
jgi:hypothetical protein